MLTLDSRARREANLPATIEIWEDSSGSDGFARKDGSNARIYTTVRVTQVSRTPRGSGRVTYETLLEFYIEDASYQDF